MKNKVALLFLLSFILVVSACDKKSKRQYSEWKINEEHFSSNNVTTTIGKARMDIECTDPNRYGITFNLGYSLPVAGTFGIEHVSGQHPDSVSVGFYKGSIFYVISPFSQGVISSSEVNKKARYTLAPTWFINYHNHQDSVLISGEFNEP